jgi:hypothetical protein
MARQPTMIAMYVEARGAHWLSGSSSLLTRCMFSNNTAEMPSDAPEKARTIIRKIKGINGFFNINLCSNVSKVTIHGDKGRQVLVRNSMSRKIDDARLDRRQKDSLDQQVLHAGARRQQKTKEQVDAASVDRTQYLQNA